MRSPRWVVNRINYVIVMLSSTGGAFEIVPTGSDLIVETKIDPKDIADIIIGQDVKISLTAYILLNLAE